MKRTKKDCKKKKKRAPDRYKALSGGEKSKKESILEIIFGKCLKKANKKLKNMGSNTEKNTSE